MSLPDGAHLLIGTPAYSGWVNYRYMFTVLGLVTSGISCTVQVDPWAALLTTARNDMVTEFYRMWPENRWTHLLFLDADVAVEPESILRMVGRGVDAIAAPIPLKGIFPDGPKFSIQNPRESDRVPLLEADAAATGCFLLSKAAVFALVEKAKAEGRVYRWPSLRNPGTYREVYDVFTVGTVDGAYDTEDWSMCRQLRELGFTIYVDPTVRASHYGVHEFVPGEVMK